MSGGLSSFRPKPSEIKSYAGLTGDKIGDAIKDLAWQRESDFSRADDPSRVAEYAKSHTQHPTLAPNQGDMRHRGSLVKSSSLLHKEGSGETMIAGPTTKNSPKKNGQRRPNQGYHLDDGEMSAR